MYYIGNDVELDDFDANAIRKTETGKNISSSPLNYESGPEGSRIN